MKKIILVISFIFFALQFCLAETIILKSGKQVEGRILEETDEYIKVDIVGIPIKYYLSDIESIDGKEIRIGLSMGETNSKDEPILKNIDDTNKLIPIKDKELFYDAQKYDNRGYKIPTEQLEALPLFVQTVEPPSSNEVHEHIMKGIEAYGKVVHYGESPAEALRYYSKAVELDPRHAGGHIKLGFMYVVAGQYRKAIPSFQKIIELFPDRFEGYYNMGVVHELLKEYQEALGYYSKAIKKIQKYDESYLLRLYVKSGKILVRFGRFQEAIDAYKKAIEIDHHCLDAHVNLSLLYSFLGNDGEARKTLINAKNITDFSIKTILILDDYLKQIPE
jgi:tetratricopeptide (TPR) repeat protein